MNKPNHEPPRSNSPIPGPILVNDAASAGLVRVARKSLVLAAIVGAFFAPIAAASAANVPKFDKVVAAMTDYFKSQPDYQAGDLLNQSQAAGALAAIASAGWEVPNAKKIVSLALADNSFLVTQLATPNGKRFMRKIAKTPGTYSRLDRLSKISNGQSTVKTLIRDPGGDTMLAYMATTPGGKNLGAMMAGTPDGTNLNKPTGRIYTADDLLAVVKQMYDASANSP
jgi:hypothetical protein